MRGFIGINWRIALRPDCYRGLRDQIGNTRLIRLKEIGNARLERLKKIEGDWKCEIGGKIEKIEGD